MSTRPITLDKARAQYVHRYTMEHAPSWASSPAPNGKYYAPQYRTDAEWYARSYFPGEKDHPLGEYHGGSCHSADQTWPLGHWLEEPFKVR